MARRAIASKALQLTQPSGRFSKICFSTAFEGADGANAVADARESGGEVSGTSRLPAKETLKEGLYEARHQDLAGTSDHAEDGPVKATEMAEETGRDTAKPTMDGAWKASKETTEQIKGPEGPGKDRHHDHEYDPVQGPIDDLRNRAGGYDLSEN
ncbi:uncharacterized protein [Pyrus communis]|uniref:uncharacterized protein n=1 Tax=Pyrus communis TaxID=23211 RepID=UPI0035C09B79